MTVDKAARIKCGSCERVREPLRFSDAALKKYWGSLGQVPKSSRPSRRTFIKLPLCHDCSPQQVLELTCIMCGVSSGLERFSKAQRRKPDDAHCLDCQQEKDDREPHLEDEKQEIEIIEELREMRLTGSTCYPSQAGGVSRSRISTRNPAYETDTNPATESDWYQPELTVPSISRTQNHRNLYAPSASIASNSTRSDASGITITTGSGTGTGTGTAWDHFRVFQEARHSRTRVGSAMDPVSRPGNPGFVKQGAVKKHLEQKAMEAMQREDRRIEAQEEQAAARNDSDDDSDEEAPY